MDLRHILFVMLMAGAAKEHFIFTLQNIYDQDTTWPMANLALADIARTITARFMFAGAEMASQYQAIPFRSYSISNRARIV